jgi:hypothetical protein
MGAIDDLLRRVNNAEEDLSHAMTLVGILVTNVGGSVTLNRATLENPGEYETKVTEDPVTGSITLEVRHTRIIEGE